jgi:alkaline phosphatase
MYQAELAGKIGRKQWRMTQFPVVGVSSTYSASHGVTDSAASGTALATSHKTTNRYMGIDSQLGDAPVSSIAVWAKQAGKRVGVATSVNINHATPGAFYAHEKDRGMYYEIGSWLPRAGFDFYGGSDFNNPQAPEGSSAKDLYTIARDSGYVIARGYDEYRAQAATAERMILFQPQSASDHDAYSIPYAIDATPADLTIPQILTAEIDFLMKDSTQGFFLMNEIGGKVDFACHGNDGASAFAEVAAVDSCIRIAYDFYLRHPDETLIVLTADHETGGLVLNGSKSVLNLKLLSYQKGSQDAFTERLHNLRTETGNQVTWEQAKTALSEHYGFWKEVSLTEAEEADLKKIYEKSFQGQMASEKNLYSENEPLAAAATRLLNTKAGLTWCTGGHSAGLVPVYACGVGAECFAGHNDNSQIPLIIADIAGYKHE